MMYVQNNHIASIACVYKTKDNTDALVTKSVMFRIESIDKMTGVRINSNFTKIEDSVLEELKTYSKVFTSYVDLGKFVIHQDIPAEYMTGDDILVDLRFKLQKITSQAATLEEENKVLKAELEVIKASKNKEAADVPSPDSQPSPDVPSPAVDKTDNETDTAEPDKPKSRNRAVKL